MVYVIDDGGDSWGSVASSDVLEIGDGTGGLSLTNADYFGYSVSLDDGLLSVGAWGDDTDGSGGTTGTARGAVHIFDRAFEATLATGDFEKGTVATGKLGEGTVTVSATPTDAAGNAGTAATGTFIYDQTVPTISSGEYAGTTVTLTMSENVYASTAPDANDFTVVNDSANSGGTDITPSGITIASTAATASTTVTLTVPTTTWAGVVKVYYTQDSGDTTKRAKDVAGNNLASLASGSAITLTAGSTAPTAPTLALSTPSSSPGNDSTPTITVTVDSNQTNGTVQLFSDSSCSTSLSSSVTVDAATEDVTTTTLTEANSPYTIYAKHTNSNDQGTCSTTSVSYTYDGTAPTVTATIGGTVTARTVSASDNDSGTTTMKYKLVTSSTTCDATALSSGTTAYTEGAAVTVAAADNGKKACFSVQRTRRGMSATGSAVRCQWRERHRRPPGHRSTTGTSPL